METNLMSTLSQFSGGIPTPKVIVNDVSTTGWVASGASVSSSATYASAKAIASGALAANTLKTILQITGSGGIQWLSLHCADATSRTLRMKITIDGVVAIDSTSAAIAGSGYGGVYIGAGAQTNVNVSPMYFKKSLLIEIASSLSETDKLVTSVNYFTA